MEYIPNHLGTEYHVKRSGKWRKEKIEEIGVELPEGAVLQEELTREQKAEISEQQEAERITAMTPEQKEEAKENELDALADKSAALARRHEIRRKPFDPVAFYDKGAKIIAAKYK
jgi:ABC-type transport system involved in cytochrome bd biosynthesis fused ATPase/permease subunit